jgi:hypothetical protein
MRERLPFKAIMSLFVVATLSLSARVERRQKALSLSASRLAMMIR